MDLLSAVVDFFGLPSLSTKDSTSSEIPRSNVVLYHCFDLIYPKADIPKKNNLPDPDREIT